MLNPKQKKCIGLMVQGEFTQKQIAETIHVSENTISNWKKDEEFMSEYNASLLASINWVAAKAFKTQIKLLTARSEMVRHLVAKDILDRAGYKPEDNIKLSGPIPVVISGSDELED